MKPTDKFEISARELRVATSIANIDLQLNCDGHDAKYCMVKMGAYALLLLFHSKDREGTMREYKQMLDGIVLKTMDIVDKEIAELQLREGATKQ